MAKKPDMNKSNTPQHKLLAAGKPTPQSSGKAAPKKGKK